MWEAECIKEQLRRRCSSDKARTLHTLKIIDYSGSGIPLSLSLTLKSHREPVFSLSKSQQAFCLFYCSSSFSFKFLHCLSVLKMHSSAYLLASVLPTSDSSSHLSCLPQVDLPCSPCWPRFCRQLSCRSISLKFASLCEL